MAVKRGIGPDGSVRIPKAILREFQQDARVIIKLHPAGLWPIPLQILKNPEFIKRLASDAEIAKNFDVIIVPKG